MKFIIVFLVAVLLGYKKETIDLVISNPKIVNTQDGSITVDHDILIKGNVITDIVPHRKKYDKSIKIIDATNLFAIPGLWDMHVHALWSGWFDICSPLMLAYGVTGFRDTWGELKYADSVKRKMATGQIPFQRFLIAGGLIDGARPIWPTSQVAENPERGVQLVDSLYNAGADFIKVYSRLTPGVFFAIAKRCKELKIKFVGHVPQKVKLVDASNAGMYSMEHLLGMTEAFSDLEDSIFAVTNRIDFANGDPNVTRTLSSERQTFLLNSKIVPEKVEKVCFVLKANSTWITPTVVVLRGLAYMDVLDTIKDERLDYLPREVTSSWKVENDFRVKSRTAQQWNDAKKLYHDNLARLKLLNQRGVSFLTGTDLGNPYCFPGSSLHEEFELLQQDGFTPLQILQAATLNAAKYLNKTDSLGSISPNKYADILLLADNPLNNISNTRNIQGLLMNGKFYTKSDLEILKQQAKRVSAKMDGSAK